MIEWFMKLSNAEKIAIVVPVAVAVCGGLFGLLKWLLSQKVRTTETPSDTVVSLPPDGIIHNLPYRSIGRLLKGRTKHMQSLKKQLSAAQTTAITQPAAIHGLGGVGKTRLAVEYAIHAINAKTYTAVFFVTADSVFSLNANLAALAGSSLLNLPEFNQPDQSVIVEAVIRNLSHRDESLLILDNVDDDAARRYIFEELLGKLTAPHILITSRLSDWPPDIADLSVTKLNKKEAASYLRTRTQGKRSATKNDNASSENLAAALDGLPVALEQAAAYISRMRITFDIYIQEFNDSRGNTLTRYEDLVNYDSPVLFTWISTQARLNPVAHGILRLAAFLAPDPIPAALFESQPDSLTPVIVLLKQEKFYQEIQPSDCNLNIHDSLAELAGWSMINLAGDSFIVHRIVQDSVRLTIPSDMQKKWTELALNLVNGYIPGDPPPQDVRSWPLWTILEPHVACIIQKSLPFNIPEPTGYFMNQLGIFLEQRVRFAEAEVLYKQSLASNEEILGPDHPTVAACLNNLATLYQDTNRLKEAEPLMKRVIKILEKSLGENHPKVATALNNLAMLYQDTNRIKEAEPLMARALKIDEASLGAEHPDVATDLNNLAQLYQATNRLKEAEPLMQRALKIDEAALGAEHPDVARDLNNLAQLYQAINRLKEAEPLMQRALKIDEAALGTEHINVARDLSNLASLYKATNRLKEAEPLMQRALKIDESSLGKDHPNVAIRLSNLAVLYNVTNRLKEAEQLMERNLLILLQFTRQTGHPHPHLEAAINNYTSLLMQMGHSKNQVAARLKSLAPEMFDQPEGPAEEQ